MLSRAIPNDKNFYNDHLYILTDLGVILALPSDPANQRREFMKILIHDLLETRQRQEIIQGGLVHIYLLYLISQLL